MRDGSGSKDPRKGDPPESERIDPKTGRLEPDSQSPGDGAWENDLTEEDTPDPAEREASAHDLNLDP